MKNLLCILFLAVFVTATAPALAADYSADDMAWMTTKAVFEDPATEKQMRVIMPDAMTKLNATATAVVGGTAGNLIKLTSGGDMADALIAATDVAKLSTLAVITSSSGATLIGVYDNAGYFVGTTVETVLAELGLFAAESEVKVVDVVDAALPFGSIPAAPADGYRVFATTTGGAFVQGYIYTYDTTGAAYDAGVLLANASMLAVKGAVPDIIVGGAAAGNYQALSQKQNLVVPATVGNIATLGADGQILDSTYGLDVVAFLVATPTPGNFVCTDALGQPYDCASAPGDYVLEADLLTTGNTVPIINTALDGVDFPAAPTDGYRIFCTATGGGYDEGKIYTYTVGTGYNAGVSLLVGQMVQTRDSNFILGGLTLADWVQLDNYAIADYFETRITQIVDVTSATIPADPGIEGYRVFMTGTDGALAEGFIYVWDDTGNVWDAGTKLADGQIVTAKGANPDIIVGGTDATNYEQLSKKLDADELACKDVTVALGEGDVGHPGVTAADPDWVGAYYFSASSVSAVDQVVASVVIGGDGAITLVTAAVSSAEAVYRVCAILD